MSFRHKAHFESTPQFGLITEELAWLTPCATKGVNAMLLNEFLKEHRKIEQQRSDFETALVEGQV